MKFNKNDIKYINWNNFAEKSFLKRTNIGVSYTFTNDNLIYVDFNNIMGSVYQSKMHVLLSFMNIFLK